MVAAVFIVDDRVVSTQIGIGLRNNELVEVTSGLAEGDDVVARAGTFVSDGDLIAPVRAAEMTGAVSQ